MNLNPLYQKLIQQKIYCCMENVIKGNKCRFWKMCDNKKNCLNYHQIKDEKGCKDGQWFHFKCTKLKNKPSRNPKWSCHLRNFFKKLNLKKRFLLRFSYYWVFNIPQINVCGFILFFSYCFKFDNSFMIELVIIEFLQI